MLRQPTRGVWTIAVSTLMALIVIAGIIIYNMAREQPLALKPLKLAVVRNSPGMNWIWPVLLKEVDYFEFVKFYVTGYDTTVGGWVGEGVYEDYEMERVHAAVKAPSWYATSSPKHVCNVRLRPHKPSGDSIFVDIDYVFNEINFRSPSDIRNTKTYQAHGLEFRTLQLKDLTVLTDHFKPNVFQLLFWTRSPEARALERQAKQNSFAPMDLQTESLADVAKLSSGVNLRNISGTFRRLERQVGGVEEAKDFRVTPVDTLYPSPVLPVLTPLRQTIYRLSATIKPFEGKAAYYIEGLYVVPVQETLGGLEIRIYQIWRWDSDSRDPFIRSVQKIDQRQVRNGDTFEVRFLSPRKQPFVKDHQLPLIAELTISF